jgi:hypothetical protein
VNDVVTVAVYQAQVVEGVVVVVSVVVMYFYHVLCREGQSTVSATARLSFERSRNPSRFAGVTSRPGWPVGPIAVIGAFVPLHLNTAADHRLYDVRGGNLDCGGVKTYSITGFVLPDFRKRLLRCTESLPCALRLS